MFTGNLFLGRMRNDPGGPPTSRLILNGNRLAGVNTPLTQGVNERIQSTLNRYGGRKLRSGFFSSLLKTGWQIDELPIKLEFSGDMRRECFDTECFGRVMTGEQKVETHFRSGDRSPMRRFASNEGINSFGGNALNLTASRAGDDAKMPNGFRAKRDG